MTEPESPFDLESGYSASLIHFSLIHWPELGSHSLRESLSREWQMLPRHASGVPYRLCLCGKLFEKQSGSEIGGLTRPSSRTPEVLMLDIQLAYVELPIAWHGRTEVWLLMNGSAEQQIADMRQRGGWPFIHRSRLTAEIATLGARYPRLQDRDPETQSPWSRMARILNGYDGQPGLREPSTTVAA